MKKKLFVALVLAFAVMLTSCTNTTNNNEITTENVVEESTTQPIVTEPVISSNDGFGNISGTFASTMTRYSGTYFENISGGGTIEDVYYEYNSVTKHSIVYLPPNYDSTQKYDIIYVLGGGKSDCNVFFEKKDEDTIWFKNFLDHAILNDDIKPTIVASMSFYPGDDREATLDNIESLLDNFADEMLTVAIPTIESKYSTYAINTTQGGIIASRKHRAFGGFSQGANTTWRLLAKCPEYFYYYLPMCGGTYRDYIKGYNLNVPETLRNTLKEKGISPMDYFVYSAVGEDDYTRKKMDKFIGDLKLEEYSDVFIFTDNDKSQGNITYKILDEGHHYYTYCYHYIVNGVRAFWH